MSGTLISGMEKVGRAGNLGSRAFLIAVSKEALGKALILEEEGKEYTIGRDAVVDFELDDPKVSKHHCSVSLENGEYILKDNGSTNQTYLNNKPVKKPAVLSYGDRIIVGRTILRFFYEEELQLR